MDQLGEIRKTLLLNSLSEDEIRRYLNDGSFKISVYGKNSIVHFAGEYCSKLEIIMTGRIVIDHIDESGNLMTIAEFLGDEILGGNLLFSKNPHYPMTVTAKQPAVILEITKKRVFELFSENSDLLYKYLQYVSDHAAILGDRIKHYVNKTIRESIMSYLDYEQKNQGSNHIKLKITKKALAERIGVQRTSLSRELSKMRDEGIIRFDAGSIELL